MTVIICCAMLCITVIVCVALCVTHPIKKEYKNIQEYRDWTPRPKEETPAPIGFATNEVTEEGNSDVLADMMGDAMELFTGSDRVEEKVNG